MPEAMPEPRSGRVSGVVLTDEDAALVVALVDQLRALGRRHGFAVGRRILELRSVCVPIVDEANAQTPDLAWLIESSQNLVEYVDVRQAATALECSPQNIRYLIQAGHLDAQRIGGRWAVEVESVRTYSEPKRDRT